MKTILKLFLIGAILGWLPSGWCIGRVGNGVISDPKLGFEVRSSHSYPLGETYEDSSFRMSRLVFSRNEPWQDYIQFSPLATIYPELNSMDRAQAVQWKTKVGGHVIQPPNQCIDLSIFESSTLVYGMAQWGVGKGVFIFGPISDDTRHEISKTLLALQLEAGACAWK